VVVAFVGPAEDLPDGVSGVSLSPDEPLAKEWVLLLLDATLGTTLTAVDRDRLDLGERTVEAARTFTATWSFVRDDAAADARRVLGLLGDRLDPVAQRRAERVLRGPERAPDALEQRFTAALTVLVEALDAGVRRRRELDLALSTVRHQAEQDRLTGLHNRHYLERFLGTAAAGSVLRLCALLVDVDRLKALNDECGHAAGDAALTAVAAVLRESVREDDVVVRWGGDEFLVLLPGAGTDAGRAAAQRVVEGVRRARLPEPWADVPLTVSVGVSPADPTALPLARLDEALVRRQGRRPRRAAPGRRRGLTTGGRAALRRARP
jgi:diguanylate cyclase (GGDEF)-like protein